MEDCGVCRGKFESESFRGSSTPPVPPKFAVLKIACAHQARTSTWGALLSYMKADEPKQLIAVKRELWGQA